MNTVEPLTELEPRFSSDGAVPTPWSVGRERLEQAAVYWLATVRPDGRPHVTPLFAVWLDGALYFCTGAEERKAKNLARSSPCVMTTGCNTIAGLDVVVEGVARRVRDAGALERIAASYASKYGWRFSARDGALRGEAGNVAIVFELRPSTAFGFGKGEPFSQTRWRFEREPRSSAT